MKCYHFVADGRDCSPYPQDDYDLGEFIFEAEDIVDFLENINTSQHGAHYSFNRILAIFNSKGECQYRTYEFAYLSKLREIDPDFLKNLDRNEDDEAEDDE